MTTTPMHDPKPTRRSLRLWPGVVLVALQWLLRFGLPVVAPQQTFAAIMSGLAGGIAILLWWLFFSRASWAERLGAPALAIGAGLVTSQLVHESIATGAQGMLYPILAVPVLSLAFVVWAVLSSALSEPARWAALLGILALTCAGLLAIQTYGVSGDFRWDFAWRWSKSPEERLLERTGGSLADASAVAAPVTGRRAEWPGFRGARRDGVVDGVQVGVDWSTSPPIELWRRPVGPGWSSFAVLGDLVYTQEQRGEEEVVACYHAESGEPVWQHADPARFWEAMAGAGPRGTPTVEDGTVYALGATGILNALDAADGSVRWSRNAADDTGATLPGWGFAGSPLVLDDLVVVATAGTLAAYDRATGAPRWIGPEGEESYGSPHWLILDATPQILLLTGDGLVSVAPDDGELLWQHPWPGFHSLQPALLDDGDLLIASSGSAGGVGIRRLAVGRGTDGWTVEEGWTSLGLKPYFNDFVVHEGHAYGFDNAILAAIGLDDGERAWKGGRYGHGQLLLLPDQDLLLVLSEKGELALVGATPEGFRELGRIPAIEGKTWNHPVLVDDLLLVRNDREMAAFRLPGVSG